MAYILLQSVILQLINYILDFATLVLVNGDAPRKMECLLLHNGPNCLPPHHNSCYRMNSTHIHPIPYLHIAKKSRAHTKHTLLPYE